MTHCARGFVDSQNGNLTFKRSLSDKGLEVSRMFRNSSTNLITVTGLKKGVADISVQRNIKALLGTETILVTENWHKNRRVWYIYSAKAPFCRAQALVATPQTLEPLTNVSSVTKSGREKGSGHCDITAATNI